MISLSSWLANWALALLSRKPASSSSLGTLLELAEQMHERGTHNGLLPTVTVLHYGRVIADGSREEIRADPQVREIYLGG